MFDTPELSPVCTAPFVAIFAGGFLFVFGLLVRGIIEKRIGKEQNWLKVLVPVFSIAVIPIACIASVALRIGSFDPAPWFKPTTSDIAGTWVFSSGTIQLYKYWTNLDVPEHELVFNDDGTFYVRNLPSFWMIVDSYNKIGFEENINGSGTWYLGQIEGTERMEWIIFAQFQIIDGKSDSHPMRFYFQGHLPPYRIVTLDSWDLIFKFRKKLFDWK